MQSTSVAMDDDPEGEPELAVRKGPWTLEEDLVLVNYVNTHGEGAWNSLARAAGLQRTGKSCRLRWLNYLSPNVRRGGITPEEHEVIVQLHAVWGNKWSKIASHLPGRTDNEVKNYWRTRMQAKKQRKNQDWSSSSSGRAEVAFAPQEYGIVVPQASVSRLDVVNPQGYEIPGAEGGSCAGAMDVPPGFLAMSDENFWPLEDFLPTVQSFHSNGSPLQDSGRRV